MNKIVFPTFILFLSLSASAQQSSISGVVTIHNSKYETGKTSYVNLAQVEENLKRGNPTTTDIDGQFRLILVGIAEMEQIGLSVIKEGLEVVNHDKLNVIVNQKEKVRISMASPDYIADFRKNIYQVGLTQAEKALRNKIEETQQGLSREKEMSQINTGRIKVLEGLYSELLEEFKKIDENARVLANKYAKINLDEVSDLYRETFGYFETGDLEKALKTLLNADLMQQYSDILNEKKEIAKIRKEVTTRDSIQMKRTEEIIPPLRLKADLHKLRYEFDSTENVFYSSLGARQQKY